MDSTNYLPYLIAHSYNFIFLNYDGSLKDFNQLTLFIKKVKMALWLTLAASLLMPLYWSLVINKANVRKSAVNYAKTLIDLVYKV